MIPASTEHPVEFPTLEAWKDNPRLATGKSIFNLLQRSVGPIKTGK